jgi:hypothetical protein
MNDSGCVSKTMDDRAAKQSSRWFSAKELHRQSPEVAPSVVSENVNLWMDGWMDKQQTRNETVTRW